MSRGIALVPSGRLGALRRDSLAGLMDEELRIEVLGGEAMVEPRFRDVKPAAGKPWRSEKARRAERLSLAGPDATLSGFEWWNAASDSPGRTTEAPRFPSKHWTCV